MIDRELFIAELKRKKVYGALEKLYKFLLHEEYNQCSLLDPMDNYIDDALTIIEYYDVRKRDIPQRPLLRNLVGKGLNRHIPYVFAYILHDADLVHMDLYKPLRECYRKAVRDAGFDNKTIELSHQTILSIVKSEDHLPDDVFATLDDVIPFLEKINAQHKDEVKSLQERCDNLERELENQKSLAAMHEYNEHVALNKILEMSKARKGKGGGILEPIKKYFVDNENLIKYEDIIDYIGKHTEYKSVIQSMLEALLPKDRHAQIFADVTKKIKEVEGDNATLKIDNRGGSVNVDFNGNIDNKGTITGNVIG